MGVWESTLDPSSAGALEGALTPRVRQLPGLLFPEGFRLVATLSPGAEVVVAPPVACLAHIDHEAGARPDGLPEGVSTVRERSRYRPRSGVPPEAGQATVRIHLDREGVVIEVDSIVGDEVALSAARDILLRLSFDPALRNGESEPSEIVQTISFSGALTEVLSARAAG